MTSTQDTNNAKGAEAGALGVKDVSVTHGTFRCRRGHSLYTTTYQPAVRRTNACLVFHHGLADHSERHGRVLAHLCSELGMPVYTYDAHGHGRSEPLGPLGRALILSYTHLVDDLLDFTRLFVVKSEEADPYNANGHVAVSATANGQAGGAASSSSEGNDGSSTQPGDPQREQQQKPRPRIFLLGYSMGGLASSLAMAETCPEPGTSAAAAAVAASPSAVAVQPSAGEAAAENGPTAAASSAAAAAAAGGSTLYEGLMLTSCLTDPLYGNHPVVRAIKVVYVTALSWLVPALPMFKRNPVESGIRDPVAAAAMADDNLWYRGKFKVATVASLLAACARLRRTARRLCAVPLYVQHATVDMSCSLPSMHAFLARVRPSNLTMHVAEGAYHDLHHDPETPLLLQRMTEWLRKRV